MSDLYKKPILFAIVSALVVLAGTIVTMIVPMFTAAMHPRLDNLKPFTPMQLAGRDIYQREGCNNCHTQTIRPLKTEVMRYGEYSKAGEFAYDHPHLWGSKRTGPDLARVGSKYPAAWHYAHFQDPKTIDPRSNMPVYGWLKERRLDPQSVQGHMEALGLPFEPSQIEELKSKTELDALVAYILSLGHAVSTEKGSATIEVTATNPLAGDPGAIKKGEALYGEHCAACHGEHEQGGIGPNLRDNVWLSRAGDIDDRLLFTIIANGTKEGKIIEGHKARGGMPAFASSLGKNKIWELIAFIRSHQK